MKKTVYNKRIEGLRRLLSQIRPDTLWIMQPENRRYFSGFKAGDPQINESSGSLIINNKYSFLITDSRYTIEAQKEAPDFEVITIKNSFNEEFLALLSRINCKLLGFEGDFITWKSYGQISRKLKKLKRPVRMTPLKGLAERLRIIKDPLEIKAMEASSAIMTCVLDEVIPRIKVGVTENEIAWMIESLARKAGADSLAFPSIVASGPNGALPHAVPSSRKIRKKDPVVIDVGVKLDGYCCDMTRTIFPETPGPEFRKIYMTVRKAQISALQEVRPGIKSTLPDSIARRIIADAGFGDYFGHALGHGVGLATHENPKLSPRNPVELEKSMVVTVEPGIYIPGKGGVRLEEMVVIEENGARILTKADHYYDFD